MSAWDKVQAVFFEMSNSRVQNLQKCIQENI